MADRFCPGCGAFQAVDHVFCSKCGRPLADTASPTPPVQAAGTGPATGAAPQTAAKSTTPGIDADLWMDLQREERRMTRRARRNSWLFTFAFLALCAFVTMLMARCGAASP